MFKVPYERGGFLVEMEGVVADIYASREHVFQGRSRSTGRLVLQLEYLLSDKPDVATAVGVEVEVVETLTSGAPSNPASATRKRVGRFTRVVDSVDLRSDGDTSSSEAEFEASMAKLRRRAPQRTDVESTSSATATPFVKGGGVGDLDVPRHVDVSAHPATRAMLKVSKEAASAKEAGDNSTGKDKGRGVHAKAEGGEGASADQAAPEQEMAQVETAGAGDGGEECNAMGPAMGPVPSLLRSCLKKGDYAPPQARKTRRRVVVVRFAGQLKRPKVAPPRVTNTEAKATREALEAVRAAELDEEEKAAGGRPQLFGFDLLTSLFTNVNSGPAQDDMWYPHKRGLGHTLDEYDKMSFDAREKLTDAPPPECAGRKVLVDGLPASWTFTACATRVVMPSGSSPWTHREVHDCVVPFECIPFALLSLLHHSATGHHCASLLPSAGAGGAFSILQLAATRRWLSGPEVWGRFAPGRPPLADGSLIPLGVLHTGLQVLGVSVLLFVRGPGSPVRRSSAATTEFGVYRLGLTGASLVGDALFEYDAGRRHVVCMTWSEHRLVEAVDQLLPRASSVPTVAIDDPILCLGAGGDHEYQTRAPPWTKEVDDASEDAVEAPKQFHPSGVIFHGRWVQNTPSGPGTFYFPNGHFLSGQFEEMEEECHHDPSRLCPQCIWPMVTHTTDSDRSERVVTLGVFDQSSIDRTHLSWRVYRVEHTECEGGGMVSLYADQGAHQHTNPQFQVSFPFEAHGPPLHQGTMCALPGTEVRLILDVDPRCHHTFQGMVIGSSSAPFARNGPGQVTFKPIGQHKVCELAATWMGDQQWSGGRLVTRCTSGSEAPTAEDDMCICPRWCTVHVLHSPQTPVHSESCFCQVLCATKI